MKVFLVSLGCSKNLVDSEIMLGVLKQAGFSITEKPEAAQVAIVNTCAFINDAKQEAIEAIFELVRLKEQGGLKTLIVAGCLSQRYTHKLSSLLKEADGFLGPGNIHNIVKVVALSCQGKRPLLIDRPHYLYKDSTPRKLLTPSHYAYVKIADGCNNRCGYCIIPQIRGNYRSRTIESVIKEAKGLAKAGVKEINLISQDTTFYGQDRYGKPKLDVLLKRLVKIRGLKWIRMLYAHPHHLKPSLLDIIARESKICNYIDLPIQHINDKILKLMQRKIASYEICKLIDDIRKRLPEAALRTTLIVGYPQETEKDFKQLCDFVQAVGFERLGVFKYSRQENTPAAKLSGHLPDKIKEKRFKKIMLLQQKAIARKNSSLIGRQMDVLIDRRQSGNVALGRSQFDAPEVDGLIYVRGKNIKEGDFIKVKITDSLLYDLCGVKL